MASSSASTTRKGLRETTPTVLRNSIVQRLGSRITTAGEISFPCIPALIDTYLDRLQSLWDLLGKRFSDKETSNLRYAVQRVVMEGFRTSSQARLVVSYRTGSPPEPGIVYRVELKLEGMEDIYARWVVTREPPLFGKHADAKVIEAAGAQGSPREVSVLDLGAGTGRNALALAALGHPVTAVEPVPALAAELREAAYRAGAGVRIVEGDVFSNELSGLEQKFHLVVLAEVLPHLRGTTELRPLVSRVAELLAPGGRLLLSSFVAMEGYKPDPLAREFAELAWCSIFTRADLSFLTEELPFYRIADESVYTYEKEHLPAGAWPPTGWFEEWALGRNVFALPAGRVPIELRWLEYGRR